MSKPQVILSRPLPTVSGPDAHAPGAALYACIKPYARVLAKRNGILRSGGESEDYASFVLHAESAVFEAYVKLGGDVECPEGFDWDSVEMWRVAAAALRRIEQGGTQNGSDHRERSLCRPQPVDGQWDIWKGYTERPTVQTTALATPHTVHEKPTGWVSEVDYLQGEANGHVPQEDVLRENDLMRVWEVLQTFLDARDFQWMIARFRDGVAQRDLAKELAATDPAYQGEGGEKRAENYINQRMRRALRAARAFMTGTKWQAEMEDR